MGLRPKLWRPDRPPSKDRWLTQGEVAAMVRACRSLPRRRHLARFILIGAYTGTRHDAITALEWAPNTRGGWIDVERGTLVRAAEGAAATKKRKPVMRLPTPLLRLARYWRRDGAQNVVHFDGRPIRKVKRSFRQTWEDAGLAPCTPHDLRRTAITWAMQGGASAFEVESAFGITQDELRRTYWQHHPDFQKSVTDAMGRRRR